MAITIVESNVLKIIIVTLYTYINMTDIKIKNNGEASANQQSGGIIVL